VGSTRVKSGLESQQSLNSFNFSEFHCRRSIEFSVVTNAYGCCQLIEKAASRYLHRVSRGKKRFGLSVLNYIVTSNHIHLLGKDTRNQVVPRVCT
jgi:hypothetical protein